MTTPRRIELSAYRRSADGKGFERAECLVLDLSQMTQDDAYEHRADLAFWQRTLRIYEDQSDAIIREVHAQEAKRRT